MQTLLLFFGLTVAYALRVNLSVAIVAMVDKSSKSDFDHFDWNEQTKSVILSSFFWGYVVTQIPAGQLAQRVGAKVLLLFSLGICSTLAVLTPLFAHLGDDKVRKGTVLPRTLISEKISMKFVLTQCRTLRLARCPPLPPRP